MLVNCTSLTHLNLGSNELEVLIMGDPDGAEHFFEGLKSHASIAELNLRDNGIGAESAKAVASVLEVNRSITALDLECNALDEAAKATLVQMAGERISLKL